MKELLCTTAGLFGALLAKTFGGLDVPILTLMIFMAIDYVTGLIVAGVFHKSRKSKNGALESNAGWKGLCRKFMTLLVVCICYRIDVVIGSSLLRNTAIIGYIANETISIIENAGIMGVKIPERLTKAIDVLNNKANEGE